MGGSGEEDSALHRHSEIQALSTLRRGQETTVHRSNPAQFWKLRKIFTFFKGCRSISISNRDLRYLRSLKIFI